MSMRSTVQHNFAQPNKMAAFRKLVTSISSECGNNVDSAEETLVWSSDEGNAQSSVADNPAESYEESEKESDSESGVGAPRKRRRLGLKTVVSCSEEDLEKDSNKPVSRKQQETLQQTTLPVKKAKGKSGPKAIWSTELLNDLVDIVANNDSYKRKLIFTNMPKASNAEVYRNIVKDMNSRCQERGKTFTLSLCQTRNKFKKLMSICKSALLTMKTASGIKRFQDDKQFGSWFHVLTQIMKSRPSCQPDQGIEPGSYSTNLSDQTGLAYDDIINTASPSPSTSSDGSNSLDSSTPKPGKIYVPIKSKKVSKKSASNEGVINEILTQIKTVIDYKQNSIAELTSFFKEENERARQHELELFKVMFQQAPANNYQNHSAMPSTQDLEPEFQRMQNLHSNTNMGNHHQAFVTSLPNQSLFTPWLAPAGSENNFSQDRDSNRSFLQL
ncbi:uncharacterized protein LOC135695495 [Rhopilema esculentum]|uniref:uncharacterized protein LOC135695495 n=1 Tax=Rhopilema esculentum TaxID=499914 RepID=UPI0031DF95A5